MKRRLSTGETEFSTTSLTFTFESTEQSVSGLRSLVEDFVSHNTDAANLIRWSVESKIEVVGPKLNRASYSVTFVRFPSMRDSSVSAEREAIQPSG